MGGFVDIFECVLRPLDFFKGYIGGTLLDLESIIQSQSPRTLGGETLAYLDYFFGLGGGRSM